VLKIGAFRINSGRQHHKHIAKTASKNMQGYVARRAFISASAIEE